MQAMVPCTDSPTKMGAQLVLSLPVRLLGLEGT